MLALRFAAVLGLVFWVGGLTALGGIAAPALFDVVGGGTPAGRALAGAAFGEALARFHIVAYACAGAVAGSLAIRAVLGPRPRRFPLRMMVSLAMTGATAWSGLVLVPRIQQAQRTIGPAAALAPDDPRRGEFRRLHGLSTSLLFIPLAGGLALIFYELKD